MKMKKISAHIDYALWEVILNGNSVIQMTKDEAGVSIEDANQKFLSSPQLDNKDLKQIDQDDLEEMNLKWKVAMISMRVKRFYKKIKRKLEFNKKELVSLDKTKVECFNCHRRGHFFRDYKTTRNSRNRSRDVGNASYKGRDNDKRPAKEEDENALVVQEGLGYDSQFNEKEVLVVKKEEVTKTVFNNHSSDEENSLANDRFKKGEGYHAVPSPLTGNYIPPKFDLSFAGLDDSIYKFKISETVTSLTKDEKDDPETSTACVEKPKEDRSSAPLIQDWDTDSDNDSVFRPTYIPAKVDFVKAGESVKPIKSVKYVKPVKSVEQIKKSKNFNSSSIVDRKDSNGKMTQKLGLGFRFTKKACFVYGSMSHLIKDYTFHEDRMAKKSVLPNNVGKETVFTRFGRIPVSAAKPKVTASTAKPVNTVGPNQRNQTVKNAGLQDTNRNACTHNDVGVGKEVYDQHYTVLPLWSSISSTFKGLDDKAPDDKPKDDTGSKTVDEPVNKEDESYIDELNRLMSQEKEVYADDIIFGSTKKSLCDEFEALMHKRFQMSFIVELTFFLKLQVKQSEEGIFVSHDKFQVTPKLSYIHVVKRIFRYLKGQPKLGLWYLRDSPFDLEAYSDSDYNGANLDRKFTTEGCQFLGRRLILWQWKKQTIVTTSTTKAEYVATTNYYGKEEGLGSGLRRQKTMGGAMAYIRSEGALIQSIDPPLSTCYTVGSGEDRMEHDIELTDNIPQTPHDSPLLGGHTPGSDEGSMTLKELMDLCTTLLQKRHILGRRKVSKQEMNKLKSQQMFQDIDDVLDEDFDTKMIVEDKGNGEKGGCTTKTVSTTRPDIIAARSITTLQPLPTIDPKDKSKGILQESKPVKKSKKMDQDQIERDAKVVPDDDKAIDYENLDVKSPIVDFESQVLGTNEAGDVHVYNLTRLDGSYKHFSTFSRMLEVLDRQDVLDLYKIIIERFLANDQEGYDLILWGDLKKLVESSEDDEI
uniref:Putative ribonuclease H-like domain-containing protein n=1 Tax=Tanacetum cinerariifolium TaxID=118510 RepID=A0A6L2JZV9_TANCI|nr:putative ribonuclease H-like domain-containing protein [Tanacetum cinerariifolium]